MSHTILIIPTFQVEVVHPQWGIWITVGVYRRHLDALVAYEQWAAQQPRVAMYEYKGGTKTLLYKQ